jgi:hypothetical protein
LITLLTTEAGMEWLPLNVLAYVRFCMWGPF